jgi:hypothetical protein
MGVPPTGSFHCCGTQLVADIKLAPGPPTLSTLARCLPAASQHNPTLQMMTRQQPRPHIRTTLQQQTMGTLWCRCHCPPPITCCSARDIRAACVMHTWPAPTFIKHSSQEGRSCWQPAAGYAYTHCASTCVTLAGCGPQSDAWAQHLHLPPPYPLTSEVRRHMSARQQPPTIVVK